MNDLSMLASQLLKNIRSIKSERDVSEFLQSTFVELRKKGLSEEELNHLMRVAHTQLHAIDPFAVFDSQEWNVIVHAKVELFRWASRKD